MPDACKLYKVMWQTMMFLVAECAAKTLHKEQLCIAREKESWKERFAEALSRWAIDQRREPELLL